MASAASSVDNFTGTDSIPLGEGRKMSLYKAKKRIDYHHPVTN
ncbi:hypothetical protein [Lentilactobacillus rapi]|nr:hypothetical protein [Lentilactobacillus rapi]